MVLTRITRRARRALRDIVTLVTALNQSIAAGPADWRPDADQRVTLRGHPDRRIGPHPVLREANPEVSDALVEDSAVALLVVAGPGR